MTMNQKVHCPSPFHLSIEVKKYADKQLEQAKVRLAEMKKIECRAKKSR